MSFPRRRTVGTCIGLLVGAWMFGCAGANGVAGPPTSNRQACERYADHLNELSECVGLVYDPNNLCEGADLVPADLIPTYDCLRANTRCDDGQPVLDAQKCQLPLVALEPPVPAKEAGP